MLNNNISENNARTDKERKWAEKWVEGGQGKGQTAAGSKSKQKIKQDKAVAKQMATR